MKKLGVILVAAAVVIGCVLAAGCTTTTSTTTPALSTDDPALTVDVVKTGSAIYNIGDTFTITLPSNPSTGFAWVDKSDTYGDGLKVTEQAVSATATSVETGNKTIVGASTEQSFTYTALKEGTHTIYLEYRKGDEEPIYVYADVMNVEKSADNHSEGSFTYTGDYTPQAGKTVLITANGNPTTGYELVVDEDELKEAGLTLIKADYEASTSGLLGAGGTYKWYVTATTPNIYCINVYEKHAGDSEKTLKFFVPVSFVIEA